MKAPSDLRPTIWRGGVLQIHITRACDKACFGCTQGSNLGGKPVMMTVEQLDEALHSIKGYFGVVGIFGGNPVLNPDFYAMCELLRWHFPHEQRGLWCNHPKGMGAVCRQTFCPEVSNLNVHLDREAYDEFAKDWPESIPVLKGLGHHLDRALYDDLCGDFIKCRDLMAGMGIRIDREKFNDFCRGWPECLGVIDGLGHWPEAVGLGPDRVGDSRHAPPFVAMQDVVPDESKRWELIAGCDVNQFWSSMICVFRGELRAYFCELAAAQAMLHQNEPDYPDLGLPLTPGWWKQGMDAFGAQVRYHCHACGIPLRGYGNLAIGGTTEQVSETHRSIYNPKTRGRSVQVVTDLVQLGNPLERATDYVQNGAK